MNLLERYRARQADRKLGPMTPDICDVCHAPLRVGERVEVCEPFDPRVEDGVLSGGGIIVAYCTAHAPKGANA